MTWAQTQTRQWLVLRAPRAPSIPQYISRDTVGRCMGVTHARQWCYSLTWDMLGGTGWGHCSHRDHNKHCLCETRQQTDCTSGIKALAKHSSTAQTHGQYRTRGVQQQRQKLASVSVRMNKPHSENNDFH